MEYKRALVIAENVKSILAPHCERIEIAGSIRRKKIEVGDIEIVCIPKRGNRMNKKGYVPPVISFIDAVNQWAKVRGEAYDKYTQRWLPEGIKCDIFTAVPENWGYILAIRTGSAEFSHKVLATGWVKKGYHGKDGFLWNQDKEERIPWKVMVPEEQDLFDLIGIPFIQPEHRNA